MSINKLFAIPYGEREGTLLHIDQVDRGIKCNCVCPACKKPLVARKGLKKKHHFAHYPGANCSSETVLHALGKHLLRKRIASSIANGRQLAMAWACPYCHDQHEGNLIKLAHCVEMEAGLGSCRPDLALLKSDGCPVAFVEVVVSHKPDENVLAYVAEHRVTLVEFHIRSADDLESLNRSAILRPTKVHLCTRPKCSLCGRPLSFKTLHVVDGECWNCHGKMKIAMLSVEGVMKGPEYFSEADFAVATKQGALLKVQYSRTAQERYMANTCSRCGQFVGRFFLHEYWALMEPAKGHHTGCVCMKCNKHYDLGRAPT